VEWFVDGTGLSCWCCRVHEFHKWVFVRHSDIVLLQPFRWCCVDCERHVNSTFFQSLWFSIVQTQVHFICPTGNFRKGVVRLNCFAKWVAAWKRVKTAGLVHIELFLLFNALQKYQFDLCKDSCIWRVEIGRVSTIRSSGTISPTTLCMTEVYDSSRVIYITVLIGF